jgi:hypothetical protein
MSTKLTLSHNNQYHLYQEMFDVSNVYFRLDKCEFEASNDSVMIQIPIEVWRKMIEDWTLRGWPKEDDHKEVKISTDWIESLEKVVISSNKNGE